VALFRSIGTTLEMIKWEHSVLTLPFGLTGAVLAARGIPNLRTSLWIVVALVRRVRRPWPSTGWRM